MNFEFEDWTKAKLTHINHRTENIGDEKRPAVDLTFEVAALNTVLTMFDGGLMSALYAPLRQDQEGQELPGVEAATPLPNLRFPSLEAIKWGEKLTGYDLSIDYGLGGYRALELAGCNVTKFQITCADGGAVMLKFQVQCFTDLTEKTLGKLGLMIGAETAITLLDAKQPVEATKGGATKLFG